MPLIKGASADRVTRQAAVIDLSDLHEQAESILVEAREEAERILQTARAQARALNEQGEQRGFEQGRREGLEVGRGEGAEQARQTLLAELRPRIELVLMGWTEALEAWAGQREQFLNQTREDALALALRLGEKITLRAIETDPSVVREQMTEALEVAGRPSQAVVLIHPDDRPLIEAWLPDLAVHFDGAPEIELREDAAIRRGGCVLRMAGGEVDASIDRQLARIAAALLPDHGGDRAEHSE